MNNLIRYWLSLLIFSFTIIDTAQSQWYDPEKVSKKARAIYEAAYNDAVDGNYRESMVKLETSLKEDPRFVEAYLSRAGIYADMKNYRASVEDFEKAFSLDKEFSSTYLLPFSISLAGTGEFDKALTVVNAFLNTPGLNEQSVKAGSYRKSTYEFAIAYAKSHPLGEYKFATQNMGDSINSVSLEYFPSLTIDGKKMIFTRRVNQDEDFYESYWLDDRWSKAVPVPGKINTNLNEGAQNISQDGQLLIFTGCNYPEGEGSCDLYMSYKTKNGNWTEPENLGGLLNTESWESSPSLSPDKQELYFSSNREGGFGGKDIWVSRKMLNGKWGRPINLGASVNTNGDEGCPFIHADNQSLYFNSNGHKGYGVTDLYVSKKNTDSTWSEPLNLGYPINTIDDEGSLIVASDGITSIYASEGKDTRGGLDLYSFKLRKEMSASKTLWVRGKVFDQKTKNGLPSSVELTDVSSGRTVTRLQTDEEGNYLITLPEGKDYAFNVNRKGYLFYSDNFAIVDNTTDSFFVVDIPLQPIEKGASIILKNIFFDTKKSNLEPASLSELDKVVALLNENPKVRVQISGHTDNVGTDSDNLRLSINRAKAVTAYLTSKGINANRLTSNGYGASRPIESNETAKGKSRNRRTELNVL